MKILIAVDGSDHTKRMFAYLGEHQALLGANRQYTVFTAVAPIAPYAARFLDQAMLDAQYQAQSEEIFAPVRTFAQQQGWDLNFFYVPGHAAEAIAELAQKEQFDLIVMGTHGHSSLGRLLLGSVTSGVLARCQVPVLLVR